MTFRFKKFDDFFIVKSHVIKESIAVYSEQPEHDHTSVND